MKGNRSLARRVFVAGALALAPFAASADDNSMSVLTGESYAYFNGLQYRLGQFSVPDANAALARNPGEARAARRLPMLLAGPMPDRVTAKRDAPAFARGAMASPRDDAKPAPRVFVPSPFRDDTGA